jgi:hypothetical protein
MRFFPAALLSTAALISQLSLAETPSSSNEQVGAVQAAVEFCSKVDSKDEEWIERQARLILPDMTKARLAAARRTADFQQAYRVIESVLKGLPLPDAVHLCATRIEVEDRDHDHNEDRGTDRAHAGGDSAK